MTRLTFEHVSKNYDGVEALVGLNLDMASGEFFSLVGPSGCGKSTAMRIAAGLETPDFGEIRVDGTAITDVPPRDRGFGLVTQQNALVGTRNAADNISLPLKARMFHKDDIAQRVTGEAGRLGVEYLLRRKPHELSGGEVQAVQLARALVARPKVLLLDEPLARVDSALRLRLRDDLARIQREHGLTTLLITADQEDAMILANRVAVLDRGRLQQIGRPIDLYQRPVNLSVAGFFGEPAMNLLLVDVVTDGGARQYMAGRCRLPAHRGPVDQFIGRKAVIGIRPEDIRLDGGPGPTISGIVDRIESRGSSTVVHLLTDGLVNPGGEPEMQLVASCKGVGPRLGERVDAVIDPAQLHLFEPVTGAALLHPIY
ncbi:MAG: ABC transporter ATP-binding protein [Acidimicrobiales bacterium]